MKLTQEKIGALALPAGKSEGFFFDDDLRGLAVRIRDGRRTWVYQFRIGKLQRRHTIGDVAGLSLKDARKAAGKLQAHARLGTDPVVTKQKAIAVGEDLFSAVAKQ